MSNRIDMKGKVCGRLTVVRRMQTLNEKSRWRCLCKCGNKVTVFGYLLRNGKTTSCGCYQSELRSLANLKHGHTTGNESRRSTEHHAWHNMKSRCLNPNWPGYADYGGRGIKICDRWLQKEKGFENFLADMGIKPFPTYTIERVNNEGDYEPANCIWTSRKRQARNRRPIGTSKLSHPFQVIVGNLRRAFPEFKIVIRKKASS